MSTKYPGGFITKSPVAPTTSAASGIWTLDQQEQAQKAGTWPSPPIFIEDLFSTYLYTGNGTTQTITNNINLSGNGGMVWTKSRSNNTYEHELFDTVRGAAKRIRSNSTDAQQTVNSLTAFGSSGYDISTDSGAAQGTNGSGATFVSWTFREQPKFFDIVTYTGDGIAGRTVAHNLGSVPGFFVVKSTSAAYNWVALHRSMPATNYVRWNSTSGSQAGTDIWNSTAPTSSVFTVGTNINSNESGQTYVAYLFAHNAGGFPASGTGSTNGISCDTFTLDGSGNATVDLGYEPQWIMIKKTSGVEDWYTNDIMRGLPIPASNQYLIPNTAAAEAGGAAIAPSSTGFTVTGLSTSGSVYIYIAIRRGPMKVPTDATKVFLPALGSSSGVYTVTTNFPVDSCWYGNRTNSDKWYDFDRLRGNPYLNQTSTAAEVSSTGAFDSNVNFRFTGFTGDGSGYINYAFQRAPGYMDVVCYTGTGSARTVSHNLTVVPELVIIKKRSSASASEWLVNSSQLPLSTWIELSKDSAAFTDASLFPTAPTATQFSVGTYSGINGSSQTYVTYLFATCAGVSKVGKYTGTGAAQTINCGFTAGSRFVLIKRTDSTGDWYVWDSTRGIIPANDPYLLINSTAAEVTGTDYVDTTNVGFDITSTAPAAINASGGTFIFLAIA